MKAYLGFVLAAAIILSMACGCKVSSGPAVSVDTVEVPPASVKMSSFIESYREDGSYYMTRQSQEIAPAAEFILISGAEPEGQYVWQLTSGVFTPVESPETGMQWLPDIVTPLEYSRLVLACFTGSMLGHTPTSSPVRILGNWAYPVKSAGDLAWYQSGADATSADIVVLQHADGKRLIARAYGYRVVSNGQLLAPSRIDVFRSDPIAMTEQRLLKIDYR